MNKNRISQLSLLLIASVMLITSSCKKDTLTQADVIKNQQLIDFVVSVIDASNANLPIDSAKVTVADGATIDSAMTDNNGLAIFSGIKISGSIPVTVQKANYTSVATTYSTTPNDYRQAQVTQTISLYPLSGNNLATIRGRLTIESNVTNRIREAVPKGTMVRAYNYNFVNDIAFTGTTDSAGNYEIKVPVGYTGNDDISLVYPQIYMDQTVAIKNDSGIMEITERPTSFELNTPAMSNAIPEIPSVWATVAAPASSNLGSGLAMKAQLVATPLDNGGYSSRMSLLNPGSGYNNGWQAFKCSGDAQNDSADLNIFVSGGQLTTSYYFTNNSSAYTSAPTVNLNANGGSGGQVSIQFRGDYDIIITNEGSNYQTFPTVSATATYYSWNSGTNTYVEQKLTDNDINDNTNVLGGFPSNLFSNYGVIRAGKILGDNGRGDTIYTAMGLASMPVFEVIEPKAKQAVLNIPYSYINSSDSALTGIQIMDGGSGYDPLNPPVITLHTLGGYGSGAQAVAEVSTDGVVSSIIMTNQGSGYVQNVNDFRNDGTTYDTYDNPTNSSGSYGYYNTFVNIYNVSPGQVFVKNAYYGTGVPDEKK